MSFQIKRLGRWGVIAGVSACLVGSSNWLSADDGTAKVRVVAQKTQKKATPKKADDGMSKDEPAKDATPKAAAPDDGMLSFKRDIAPILVANCVGCHSGNGAGVRTGKLEMTSFDKLMAGGKRGKDIVAGDPDESNLVKMIKGEATPKMPPNNGQRGFSDQAADKIALWVKQGAKLDAGLSSTDPFAKYAATIDELKRAELAKLSPEARDERLIEVGRDRWKKATKLAPEVIGTKNGHFILLSNLPKDRATKVLTALETEFTTVNKLLSTPKGPALDPSEKISIYVFKDNSAFVEFVRANENQEVETGEQARSKLAIDTPYLVAVDPASGGEEAIVVAKKATKKKKADDSAGGPDRTLAGVLTEQLVSGALTKAGKPPRWVSLGLGAFLASKLDPGTSTYYRSLRKETGANIQIGWQAKANEALGGEAKTETIRAIGFSLFEWMSANAPPAYVSRFVQKMLEGQEKLDDAIGNCLSLTRQEFLHNSELWIAEKYGRGQ